MGLGFGKHIAGETRGKMGINNGGANIV